MHELQQPAYPGKDEAIGVPTKDNKFATKTTSSPQQ